MDSTPIDMNNIPPTAYEKKSSPLIFIIIFLLIIVGGLGAGYYFYLKPRIEAQAYLKKIHSYQTDIKKDAKIAGDNLKQIYQLISQETKLDQDKNKLLSYQGGRLLQTDKDDELGALGPSVMAQMRQIKELADNTSRITNKAQKKLAELSTIQNNEKPKVIDAALAKHISEMEKNNTEIKEYFSQAEKTGNYYNKMVDVRIQLTPLFVSYLSLLKDLIKTDNPELYLERLKEIRTTLDKLQSIVKNLKSEDLPSGVEELHSDNLKVFEIFSENLDSLKTAIEEESFSKFLKAMEGFVQKIEPYSTRAVTLELNFWQNNTMIKRYQEIVDSHSKLISNTENLIKEYNIPYLTK